ncbi:MAG: reverse transcriptase-like protein [Chloroflexota bacterium]
MYRLKFDGLFREEATGQVKNTRSGFISYGWLIYKDNRLVAHGFGVVALDKHAASNIAEYIALIEGLEALADFGVGGEAVEVQGDAKCVIDQMCGAAGISSIPTRKLNKRASLLADRFADLNWQWIPRRHNRDADHLTKHAMRRVSSARQTFSEAIKMPPVASILDGKIASVIDLRIYRS